MKNLSFFTHPHVVPNSYDWLSYVQHERRNYEQCPGHSSQSDYNQWRLKLLSFKMVEKAS